MPTIAAVKMHSIVPCKMKNDCDEGLLGELSFYIFFSGLNGKNFNLKEK